MITFQFREEPFIHKRPNTIELSDSSVKGSNFPKKKKKKNQSRANLGLDETCFTLEGLTIALVED